MNQRIVRRILGVILLIGLLFSSVVFFAAENGKPVEKSQSLLSSVSSWVKSVMQSKKLTDKEQRELDAQLFQALVSEDASEKNLEEVEKLLKAGANHHELLSSHNQWRDALNMAIHKGLPYLKLFIDRQRSNDATKLSAYVNKQGSYTSCPLLNAFHEQTNRYYNRNQNHKPILLPQQEINDMLRLLLDAGANPNCQIQAHLLRDHQLITPLICLLTNATRGSFAFLDDNVMYTPGYYEMVEQILKHPATKVNQPDYNFDSRDFSQDRWKPENRIMHNKTPLMHVVEKAYEFQEWQFHKQCTEADAKQSAAQQHKNPFVPCIELLLKYGADPSLKDYQGKTALDYAPFQGPDKDFVRQVRSLLKGSYAQQTIAQTAQLPHQLAKLCTDYLSFEEDNSQEVLALIEKSSKENEEQACIELQKLFEKGANPNSFNTNGKTALMYAAQYGHQALARMLLEHETSPADTTYLENNGKSAITYAAQNGHTTVVRMLIDATPVENRKALLNEQTVFVRPGYMKKREMYLKRRRAGQAPQPVMQRSYLKRSKAADSPAEIATITEIVGQTALHGAAHNGNADIVQMLLNAGADTTIKDTAQKTAFDYATSDEVRKLLDVKK